MSRKTNRDEAERVVLLPLAELRDELGARLRRGGRLTEESTLEHLAESVTLAVAIAARPFGYEAPRDGFHVEADDLRWESFVQTIQTSVIANMVDPTAAAWVFEWVEAVVGGELARQYRAWKVMKIAEGLPSARRIADQMIAALNPAERAALESRYGIKAATESQAVEDESRLDGRCACSALPKNMKPCEVCRG